MDRRVHKKSSLTPAVSKRQPVNQRRFRPIIAKSMQSDRPVAWATEVVLYKDDVATLTSGKVVKPV